jgi:hypothetical protein
MNKMSQSVSFFAFCFFMLSTCIAFAASTVNFIHEAVELKDHNGNPAVIGDAPYSPKQTCGLATGPGNNVTVCHEGSALNRGVDNFYESHWDTAQKTQWTRIGSTGNRDGVARTYDVPYPQHGVSSGFHFQEGRNVSWGTNQQDFYELDEFTSSSGMYGKFCPPTNMQLVAPAETDPETWGHGSYAFRMSACTWCHPGGGPLEYDREGYRFDGLEAPYALLGVDTYGPVSVINPNASTLYGDYYAFDPTAVANNPPFLVSKVNDANKGVAEVDCLMCHLNAPYNNVARNYCMTFEGVGTTDQSPYMAATMGLTLIGETEPIDTNGDSIATAKG